MTLGQFVAAAMLRPDLYDREMIAEYIPADVTPDQLRFTTDPESSCVWVEPC